MYRVKVNLVMLYPRLKDLHRVQEPSNFPFLSFSLCPAYSALLSSFPWKHWTRSAGYIRQLTLPLFFLVCLVMATGDPSSLRWPSVVLKDQEHITKSVYDIRRSHPCLSALSSIFPAMLAMPMSAMQEWMCCDFSALLHWGFLADQTVWLSHT